MARSKVELAPCDQCDSTSDVRSFRITSAEMTVHVDLCAAHRKSLLRVIDFGRTPQGVERHRVVTVDYDAWLKTHRG
jgi:hypothetical protein